MRPPVRGQEKGEQVVILSEKITFLRKSAGWSQEELADRLGVSQ